LQGGHSDAQADKRNWLLRREDSNHPVRRQFEFPSSGQESSSSFQKKHIDIRYHFVRQVVKEGQNLLKYKCTNEMIADMLTKNAKALRKGVANNMRL